MYRTLHKGLALSWILILLAPIWLGGLAQSSAVKGTSPVPAGDLKITVQRRGGASSVAEVEADPGLQVVLANVGAFYATHATDTDPQELATALQPNHAVVVLHPAEDEYTYACEATSPVQCVLRHWSCVIEVSEVAGEVPVLVQLSVEAGLPVDGASIGLGLGVRRVSIGRPTAAKTLDDLLADTGVEAVRWELAQLMRMLDGMSASAPLAAAYLSDWDQATDVSLQVQEYSYVTVIDPETGEEFLLCVARRELGVSVVGNDDVTIEFSDQMTIE